MALLLARNILQKWHCLELFMRVCKPVGILVLDLPYLGKIEFFNSYGRRKLTIY
jgi:hypothetical protein